MVTPEISVVIPTLGRSIVLQTLSSLMATEGAEHLEVLLVGAIADPEVAAGVRKLIEAHPQIQHLPLSFARGDSSEKKNAGGRATRAEIIAFMDDDVIVAPDWPAKIKEAFQQENVGMVSGPSLVPEQISLAARLAGHALSSLAAGYVAYRYRHTDQPPRPVSWSSIIGCNMAYRRDVWLAIGGFDVSFWPGEEMLASHQVARSGHTIYFHPRAWVEHYPRASLRGFARQMFTYGATRVRLMRAGVAVELTPLLPGIGLLGLLLLLLIGLVLTNFFIILLVALAGYILLVLLVTLIKIWETRRWTDILLLFYIPLMHFCYGLGEWVELIMPNRDFSENQKSHT